jgi:hypothetical protein
MKDNALRLDEVLDKYFELLTTIQGSCDDVDIIEKDRARLLVQAEDEINALFKPMGEEEIENTITGMTFTQPVLSYNYNGKQVISRRIATIISQALSNKISGEKEKKGWKQGCSCYQGLSYNADPNCVIHGETRPPILCDSCHQHAYGKSPQPQNNIEVCRCKDPKGTTNYEMSFICSTCKKPIHQVDYFSGKVTLNKATIDNIEINFDKCSGKLKITTTPERG